MKTQITLTLVAAILAVQCGKDVGSSAGAAAPSAAVTSPASAPATDLKTLLDSKAKVVDVRTPGEFASDHHPRAINIPIDQVESRLAEFGDKSKPVVVYCASGVRSGRAKQVLTSAGYQNVTNAGGFRDLP